jgi:diguanylate cyclase (GGDEF)-like protein
MKNHLHQMLLAGLENGPNAVALFDADDRLCFANGIFVDLYQVTTPPSADFAGIMRSCHAARRGLTIAGDNFDAWLAGVLARRRSAPSRSYEADFTDGRWLWATETQLPDGWLYYSGTDITALKYHESTLLRARDNALLAANTDALTGLGNRRVMLAALQQALSGDGAACMIDLDFFKKINDCYGHPVGDRVLRHFAEHAGAQLRPADSLSRVGGEEFFLVLPAASVTQAATVLERLRRHLRSDPMFADLPGLRYTFSAGVTAFRAGDAPEAVMHRADAALYQAKTGGRDRHAVAAASQA